MKTMKKISKERPGTSAERQARYRASMREKGYVEVTRWVKKSDVEASSASK